MIGVRAFGVGVLGCALSMSVLHGQPAPHYRAFQLGSSIAEIARSTGAATSDARTVRSRPAVLQELEWRKPYGLGQTAADPVEQIAFSFYNDQLFRMVIDYARDRTIGMTDADMVDAISAMYGATARPAARTGRPPLRALDVESGTRIAGWGDAEYAAVLYRSSYASAFRMIVTSVRLDALARTADAEGARLDELEAPQRERARQKKEADDDLAAQEHARLVNKAAFTP